jgi:hypothetical protein
VRGRLRALEQCSTELELTMRLAALDLPPDRNPEPKKAAK